MRRPATTMTAALAIAAAPALALAAPAAAASDAQDRADEAIAAFEEAVSKAGFEDDEIGLYSGPLGIAEPDDEVLGPCFGDIAEFYDEESLDWFVDMRVANKLSGDFYLPPDGDPLDTEDFDYQEFDNIFAEVFVGESDAVDAFDAVVGLLSSEDLSACINENFATAFDEDEDVSGSFSFNAEARGDAAWLEGSGTVEFGGEEESITFVVAAAQADQSLATVALVAASTDPDVSVVEDALDAMIDALES